MSNNQKRAMVRFLRRQEVLGSKRAEVEGLMLSWRGSTPQQYTEEKCQCEQVCMEEIGKVKEFASDSFYFPFKKETRPIEMGKGTAKRGEAF